MSAERLPDADLETLSGLALFDSAVDRIVRRIEARAIEAARAGGDWNRTLRNELRLGVAEINALAATLRAGPPEHRS